MKKIYPTSIEEDMRLTPKKETVDFILNFSKAIEIKTYKSIEIETNLN